MKLRFLLPLLCIATSAHAANIDADKAEKLAEKYYTEHPVSKLKVECVSFQEPEKQVSNWSVNVREVHNTECGGDPDTAPRIATLIVNGKTGTVHREKEAYEE